MSDDDGLGRAVAAAVAAAPGVRRIYPPRQRLAASLSGAVDAAAPGGGAVRLRDAEGVLHVEVSVAADRVAGAPTVARAAAAAAAAVLDGAGVGPHRVSVRIASLER